MTSKFGNYSYPISNLVNDLMIDKSAKMLLVIITTAWNIKLSIGYVKDVIKCSKEFEDTKGADRNR